MGRPTHEAPTRKYTHKHTFGEARLLDGRFVRAAKPNADQMAPLATGPAGSPRHDVTNEIMELRLRYDLISNDCKQVQIKRAAIRDRAAGFVNTEDLSADADDGAAEVSGIEADIELTELRSYEAWEMRKTYEQVVRRLKEEAFTYPKELEGIDRTARSKDHDYENMRLMLKDAEHVRDMALKELSKVEEGISHERKERERDLQAKRRKMQHKQEAAQAHERRAVARRTAIYAEKEAVLKRMNWVGASISPTKSSRRLLDKTNLSGPAFIEHEHQKIVEYEAQFAQIKEVAGADGFEEVIEIFAKQEGMHRMLAELSRESQVKVDALKSQRAAAEMELEQARYGGGPPLEAGESAVAVNGVDERERQHELGQQQAQRDRQRSQRLHHVSGLIVEVRRPSVRPSVYPSVRPPLSLSLHTPPHPPSIRHPPLPAASCP